VQGDARQERHKAGAGIVLMCAGVACLSVNDAIAKHLIEVYSPLQILFLRNVIALPFALAITARIGGVRALRSSRPVPHLMRGFLWVVATILFFTSFAYLDLAEATALIFVAPLFITALSAVFLKEQVGWRRWFAVIAGFVGVLVVIRPGSTAFQLVSLLPVAVAFLYALLMLGARWVDPRESAWTMLLYMTGASALLSAFVVPFFWTPIQAEHLWFFVGVALFGTAGMTLMTQAFRFAPASIVAPFDYTGLLWATMLGWWFWHEVPDAWAILGAAIIVASGIFILWRERAAG